MATRKRNSSRFETNLWPGFVDVMTSLLLVMVFILSIFMVMQFFLRATIRGQGIELNQLEKDLSQISEILGATKKENKTLEGQAIDAQNKNKDLSLEINRLQFDYDARGKKIESFETQVASLIARNTTLNQQTAQLADGQKKLSEENQNLQNLNTNLTTKSNSLLSEKEQLERGLAQALSGISAKDAEAKMAQARIDALQAIANDIKPNDDGELRASIAQVMALASLAKAKPEFEKSDTGVLLGEEVQKLSNLELERLADQAAARYLREKLQNSETELTAMTLALEAERKKAEDQLTILAALNGKKSEISNSNITDDEKKRALLAIANEEIAAREKQDQDGARKLALLNQQAADLRAQLGALQRVLNDSVSKDAETRIELQTLGASLNVALAKTAAEQKQRADDLEGYRSEFFGKLREVLKDVDGISIAGDRFVFSSEVLFAPGSSELSEVGKQQIGKVAEQINTIGKNIPDTINWILRVDGHTDLKPIVSTSKYSDNWELSQARALSVVRFMINDYDVAEKRLAATGFGEFHPIDQGDSAQSLARNRRIELKLTEQ